MKPMFLVTHVGDETVEFWCDHCRRCHTHGTITKEVEERVSHCKAGSPISASGYEITMSPKQVNRRMMEMLERIHQLEGHAHMEGT